MALQLNLSKPFNRMKVEHVHFCHSSQKVIKTAFMQDWCSLLTPNFYCLLDQEELRLYLDKMEQVWNRTKEYARPPRLQLLQMHGHTYQAHHFHGSREETWPELSF